MSDGLTKRKITLWVPRLYHLLNWCLFLARYKLLGFWQDCFCVLSLICVCISTWLSVFFCLLLYKILLLSSPWSHFDSRKKKRYISGVWDEGGCVSLTFLGILVSFLYLILVLSEACGGSKLLEDTLSENYLSSSLKKYHWCGATKLFSVILLML